MFGWHLPTANHELPCTFLKVLPHMPSSLIPMHVFDILPHMPYIVNARFRWKKAKTKGGVFGAAPLQVPIMQLAGLMGEI